MPKFWFKGNREIKKDFFPGILEAPDALVLWNTFFPSVFSFLVVCFVTGWSPGKGVPAPSWAPLTPAGEREERESSKKKSMPKHRRRRKIVGVLNSRCGNASTRWAASFGEFWDQMAKYKFTSISPNFRQILGWVFEPVPSYKFVSWKSNNIRKTIKFQAAFCCWFSWNNIHFDGRKYFKMYKVHPKIFTESYSKRWDETMKISITPSSDFAGVLVAEKKAFLKQSNNIRKSLIIGLFFSFAMLIFFWAKCNPLSVHGRPSFIVFPNPLVTLLRHLTEKIN